MSRPTRLAFQVPAEAQPGLIEVRNAGWREQCGSSARGAASFHDGLHPVTSPAVSRSGMVYATISGPRGKQTPVSVVRVSPDGPATPFVTGILNATGLAFRPDGDLFVTSRAEGNVYRVDRGRRVRQSMPRAWAWRRARCSTREGNLFVGDRSGTIFKINPERQDFCARHAGAERGRLSLGGGCAAEPLFVTAPSLGSNDAIWAIEPNGDTRAWFRGLGDRRDWRSQKKATFMWPRACADGRAGAGDSRRAKRRWCWREQSGGSGVFAAGHRDSGDQRGGF